MTKKTSMLAIFLILGTIIPMTTASAVSSQNPSVFEILSKGDTTFIGAGPTQKMVVIGPSEFIPQSSDTVFHVNSDFEDLEFMVLESEGKSLFAPIHIPDDSTITEFECIERDGAFDDDFQIVRCRLFEAGHSTSSNPVLLSTLTSTLSSNPPGGFETLTDTVAVSVDRDSKRYYVEFSVLSAGSDCISCALKSMKITYTVPSGMIVGGEFYPVDNVSLLLAYGMINSYWIAPIALGVGVGLYLTRSKWKKN